MTSGHSKRPLSPSTLTVQECLPEKSAILFLVGAQTFMPSSAFSLDEKARLPAPSGHLTSVWLAEGHVLCCFVEEGRDGGV